MAVLTELPGEVLANVTTRLPYTDAMRLRLCCQKLCDAVGQRAQPTIADWHALNGARHSPKHTHAICPGCMKKPPEHLMKPHDWVPAFLPNGTDYIKYRQRHGHRCKGACVEWFDPDGTVRHEGPKCDGFMGDRPKVEWCPVCLVCVWKLAGRLG